MFTFANVIWFSTPPLAITLQCLRMILFVSLAGSTAWPRARDNRLEKNKKSPIKLVFSPQNDQINCFDSCVFLSVCFVFFLGLLGFELETPTANTGSTLRGLS